MNEYYQGPGIGGLVWRFLLLAIAAIIVLSLVITFIETTWPWLLGFALVAAGVTALVRTRGRAKTRW